jgi:leader peptidase (prepilin peptidase)/N-methyltransferase
MLDLLKNESIQVFVYFLIGIFGVLIGSFLNVLIIRIPKKEDFVKKSSHCVSCGHKLAWYDNIPLISWLILGGRCRYCGRKISLQYPIVELLNGLLWVAVFFINGMGISSLLICALASGLIVMSVIDWRTYEISNGFHVYFGVIAAINLFLNIGDWLSYVIGFFSVSLILFLIYIISKGNAIGGGDVKLMAVCGMFLGWQNTLLALTVGCVIGSAIHLIRMRLVKADRMLAMGPYLSIGIFIASLFGDQMIAWYLSLFIH